MLVVWLIVAGGWLGTVAAMYGRHASGAGDWAFVVFMLVATASLGLQRQFPNRRAGLVASWCGPAILLCWQLLASSQLLRLPPSTASHDSFLIAIIRQQALRGWVLAIVMAWLGRGYGLVSILALVAAVARPRAVVAQKLASSFPWSCWWVLPAMAIVVTMIRLTLLVWL